ncbi:Lysosome-associated membrane glycoprotein 1 [Bagarius yarrelli]|uniref:Lysosome-associated membrane glycoprotein 1 n=1 Tax=Bagarius yarrelli TaxID=175774 RepID=A0A556TKC1_BAGYA|nr:Lysosome-associated membrane glycoprotein 1 [Bagarius yarrelli]
MQFYTETFTAAYTRERRFTITQKAARKTRIKGTFKTLKRVVVVALPDSAVVANSSSCGGAGVFSDLVATFGDGHSLGLVFASDERIYSVVNLTLTYNLGDNTTFPQSISKEIVVLSTNASGILAQLNTTYRCRSSSTISLKGSEVRVTLYNIRMQAYMPSANMSTNETVCSADLPVTTVAPTTTTSITPTTPVPPTNPEPGNYTIRNDNGTVCLLAKMGLQLNVTYFSKSQNKNSTTKIYQLSTLNMSASWEDMTAPFSVSNSSLQYLQGTLGRSYMCSVEEVLPVTSTFSLNTFNLQVQPFGVQNNQFGPADMCRMQKDNMLVPIIVGASLAGLVLIVLVAYLIGRRRSHAGYQTI